jgi:hypothetical protein
MERFLVPQLRALPCDGICRMTIDRINYDVDYYAKVL